MGFLTGKTAIITGGGRAVLSDGSCGSIGYGIATAYAKEGANLVITGRNVKKLEDAKEELERLYGIKVLPVQADVSAGADNEATVQNVVKQAIDTFGRIDVLINNAQASASGVTIADHTTDPVQSGNVFRRICGILLYAGMLSVSERDKGICYQLCFRCRTFRKLRTVRICSGKRRNPWTFQSSCNRVGTRWNQCQYRMPARMDSTA